MMRGSTWLDTSIQWTRRSSPRVTKRDGRTRVTKSNGSRPRVTTRDGSSTGHEKDRSSPRVTKGTGEAHGDNRDGTRPRGDPSSLSSLSSLRVTKKEWPARDDGRCWERRPALLRNSRRGTLLTAACAGTHQSCNVPSSARRERWIPFAGRSPKQCVGPPRLSVRRAGWSAARPDERSRGDTR